MVTRIIIISYVIIFRDADTRRLDASSSHVGGVESPGRGINSNPWTVVAKVSGVQETIARYPANTTIHPMSASSPLTSRHQTTHPSTHRHKAAYEKRARSHTYTQWTQSPPPATSLHVHRVICCVEPYSPAPAASSVGPLKHMQHPRRSSTGDSGGGGSSCTDRHDRFRFCITSRGRRLSHSLSLSLSCRLSSSTFLCPHAQQSVFVHQNHVRRARRWRRERRRMHTSRISFSRRPLSVRPAAQHMCTTPTTLYAAHKVPLLLFIIIYYTTYYYSDYNTCSVPV